MKRWEPKNIKLDAEGLAKFLGERESEVMEIAWQEGCVTVRNVCDKLCEKKEFSFNTIMTIMNRLNEKGILKKSSDGSTFCYEATIEKKYFITNAVNAVFASFVRDKELAKEKNIAKLIATSFIKKR